MFTAAGGAGGGANKAATASKSLPTMWWNGSGWSEHTEYVSNSSKSGKSGTNETASAGVSGGAGGITYYWGESDWGNYRSTGYDCLTCGGKGGDAPNYGVGGWTPLYTWQSSDVWRSGGKGGTGAGNGGDTSSPLS